MHHTAMMDAPRDPDSMRDTVPIRPLKKWASRILVTVALIASAALGVYAARTMRTLATDPAVRERFDAMERMRRGESPVDSTAGSPIPASGGEDSLRADPAPAPAQSRE